MEKVVREKIMTTSSSNSNSSGSSKIQKKNVDSIVFDIFIRKQRFNLYRVDVAINRVSSTSKFFFYCASTTNDNILFLS